MIKAITELSPVLAEVIQQGVEEGVFQTDYPQETVEFLLASAQVIFDEDFSNGPQRKAYNGL